LVELNQRRKALEAMVQGMGVSSRFTPFVSNLVEKVCLQPAPPAAGWDLHTCRAPWQGEAEHRMSACMLTRRGYYWRAVASNYSHGASKVANQRLIVVWRWVPAAQGTYALAKEDDLRQLGLTDSELRAFAVIKGWAVSQTAALMMRRGRHGPGTAPQ
jgi:hypothetical protein